MRQSSTQRLRWDAGKAAVLRGYAGRILRSQAIGWHQKLDALSELAVPGPVVHAMIAIVLSVLLLLTGWPPARLVALLLVLSLLPLVLRTAWAITRVPHPVRTALSFAGLPLYALWRLGVAGIAVASGHRLGWQRSPRHAPNRSA